MSVFFLQVKIYLVCILQALREELYKQRSTVFTAATDFSDYRNVADQEEIQKLEDKVTRLVKLNSSIR